MSAPEHGETASTPVKSLPAFVGRAQELGLLVRWLQEAADGHPRVVLVQGGVVMNGVFTERRDLSTDEMFTYFSSVLGRVFPLARIGLAFNLMSAHPGREWPHLFHVPLDALVSVLHQDITGNFVIRNDYGLLDYTVYLYR